MKHHNPVEEFEGLVESARALVSATSEAAEEKILEARARLEDVLDQGQARWRRVRTRAVKSARVTDHVIRSRPYQAIGLALGLGALLGLLLRRRD